MIQIDAESPDWIVGIGANEERVCVADSEELGIPKGSYRMIRLEGHRVVEEAFSDGQGSALAWMKARGALSFHAGASGKWNP